MVNNFNENREKNISRRRGIFFWGLIINNF